MIMKHLESAVEVVREMGYTPVYAALYGSQNYGMDVYDDQHQSDYDVKIVVMPSLHDVVFKESTISKTVEYDGGQIDIKDAVSMSRIICKMNPQYMEILMTPFYLVFPGGGYMEELRCRLPHLLMEKSPAFAKAAYGMFSEKLISSHKMTPSSEEKVRKYGYDGKHLHHALRIKLMLEDFEKTNRIVLHPPVEQIPLLMQLKKNEIPLEQAVQLSRLWSDEITRCADSLCAWGPKAFPEEGCMTAEEAIMDETRHAFYFALKSSANGILPVQEVKTHE